MRTYTRDEVIALLGIKYVSNFGALKKRNPGAFVVVTPGRRGGAGGATQDIYDAEKVDKYIATRKALQEMRG